MSKDNYPVMFVGAGPGDPDLITVKGQQALRHSDMVIYAGSLVPEAVLKWTRPDATKISSASLDLGQIIDEIERAFRKGMRVVRLHTGDPSLYGAIFEQIAALDKLGIPCQVIPGVTAAFAAAAAMGLEYTLPEVCQTLILTRIAGKTPVPEMEALEGLAAHQASMAIYLSIGHVDRVGAILESAYGRDAGCVVAYRVSHPDEKIIRTTVGELPEVTRSENISRHALIIVGKVLDVSAETLKHKSRLYDQDFTHGYRK
ncbi:MAG: precorrin-4 C(11)-methyltransferase [Desulfobacteraceae bacterium]|nr:precorrin-4 C(11)-methyltransferase [Desulfobacteraceae bacterium]